jgi:hypothetical protein
VQNAQNSTGSFKGASSSVNDSTNKNKTSSSSSRGRVAIVEGQSGLFYIGALAPVCFEPDWLVIVESPWVCKSDVLRVMQYTEAGVTCGMDIGVRDEPGQEAAAAGGIKAGSTAAAESPAGGTNTKGSTSSTIKGTGGDEDGKGLSQSSVAEQAAAAAGGGRRGAFPASQQGLKEAGQKQGVKEGRKVVMAGVKSNSGGAIEGTNGGVGPGRRLRHVLTAPAVSAANDASEEGAKTALQLQQGLVATVAQKADMTSYLASAAIEQVGAFAVGKATVEDETSGANVEMQAAAAAAGAIGEHRSILGDGAGRAALGAAESRNVEADAGAAILSAAVAASTRGLQGNQNPGSSAAAQPAAEPPAVSGPKAAAVSGPKAAGASGPKAAAVSGPKAAAVLGPKAAAASGPDNTATSGPKAAAASGPDNTATSGPKAAAPGAKGTPQGARGALYTAAWLGRDVEGRRLLDRAPFSRHAPSVERIEQGLPVQVSA